MSAPYVLTPPYATTDSSVPPRRVTPVWSPRDVAPACRPAHSPPNRPNFQYDLSDIDGARGQSYVQKLKQNPRSPLDPVYQLPSCEEAPLPVPRFIRDSMLVSDITGPARRRSAAKAPSTQQCDDIHGARPRTSQLSNEPRSPCSLLSAAPRPWTSARCTSPLQPQYRYGKKSQLDISNLIGSVTNQNQRINDNADEEVQVIGDIEGSHPRRLYPPRDKLTYSLLTADICSAEARHWSWQPPPRKFERHTNEIADVPGAQASTLRRGLVSGRHTDPNLRDYWRDVPTHCSPLGREEGMVHVHRHVLDYTTFAEKWKPPFVQPADDAAGVPQSQYGHFSAGNEPPKRAVQQSSVKQHVEEQKESSSSHVSVSFAPAPDTQADIELVRALDSTPTASFDSQPQFSESEVSFALSAADDAPSQSSSSAAAAAAPRLSYPEPNKKRVLHKKHKDGYNCTGNILADPPSNVSDFQPTHPTGSRPFNFGLVPPFAQSAATASIGDTQAAAGVSRKPSPNQSRSVSRAASRPISAPLHQPGVSSPSATLSREQQQMQAMHSTASTLSNAFHMKFVPTTTMNLPSSLPFSSPLSRPGLSTTTLFERRPKSGVNELAKTQLMQTRAFKAKIENEKKNEIAQVRALA